MSALQLPAFGRICPGIGCQNGIFGTHSTENGQSVSIVASYLYNENGIRVQSAVTTTIGNGSPATTTTQFLNDPENPSGYSQVLEEHINGSTSPSTSYVVGMVVLAQIGASGAIDYLMPDGQGSTRLVVDATGAIAARYGYDAYGNVLGTTLGVTNLPVTRILYTGQQFDPLLLRYYLRARYYSPGQGIFLAIDPYQGSQSNPSSLHRYLYAAANPINKIDPTGQFSLGEVIAVSTILMAGFLIGLYVAMRVRQRAIAVRESLKNQSRTAAYADMYLRNRRVYKWAGMAALASNAVGTGLLGLESEMGRAGAPFYNIGDPEDLYRALAFGNQLVFDDLYWQHLAYDKDGLEGLMTDGRPVAPEQWKAWQDIDKGKVNAGPQGDQWIWQGNLELLRYEQEVILQGGVYDQAPILLGTLGPLMPSPVPGGKAFQTAVSGGDLASFSDRWRWISDFVVPDYQRFEPSDDMKELMQGYIDRAPLK
jgi:RHS repeat-associated protein